MKKNSNKSTKQLKTLKKKNHESNLKMLKEVGKAKAKSKPYNLMDKWNYAINNLIKSL